MREGVISPGQMVTCCAFFPDGTILKETPFYPPILPFYSTLLHQSHDKCAIQAKTDPQTSSFSFEKASQDGEDDEQNEMRNFTKRLTTLPRSSSYVTSSYVTYPSIKTRNNDWLPTSSITRPSQLPRSCSIFRFIRPKHVSPPTAVCRRQETRPEQLQMNPSAGWKFGETEHAATSVQRINHTQR
jgi:hypothetical protein